MATISDVAARAGVSIKTVSRVINGEPNVSAGTRARIVSAIAELGYTANVSAQRLASGRANAIGFVFHNPSWHYIEAALRGVLEAGRTAGYETVIHPCDIENPADCAGVVQLLLQGKVDGLIITPPCDVVTATMTELAALGAPFVRMTPRDRSGDLPFVAADDCAGAAAMTAHLLALGHRHIGFVTGSAIQVASAHRLAGYRAALAAAHVPFRPALVVQGDFDFQSGLLAGRTLLRADPRPTAIFASNDDMAAGVLAAAHEAGLRVPAELSIAGFDDTLLAGQVWPALTTVHQPVYDIARLATEMLIGLLRGSVPEQTQAVLPTRIVERASTGPAAR